MKGFSGFGNESPMKQSNKLFDVTGDGTTKRGNFTADRAPHESYQKDKTTRDEGGNRPNPGGTSRSIKQVFIDYSKAIKRKFDFHKGEGSIGDAVNVYNRGEGGDQPVDFDFKSEKSKNKTEYKINKNYEK